jgi:hypothetical protein
MFCACFQLFHLYVLNPIFRLAENRFFGHSATPVCNSATFPVCQMPEKWKIGDFMRFSPHFCPEL